MSGPLIGTDGCLTESARRLVHPFRYSLAYFQFKATRIRQDISGARMIVELVKGWPKGRNHRRQPQGHNKPSGEVCRHALQVGVPLKAIRKCNDGDQCREAGVTQAEDNQAVLSAIRGGSAQVAAGTAWLWARPEMANSVDVLFLDEAGQISLANTLAVSRRPLRVLFCLVIHSSSTNLRGAFTRQARRFHPLDICLTATQR